LAVILDLLIKISVDIVDVEALGQEELQNKVVRATWLASSPPMIANKQLIK